MIDDNIFTGDRKRWQFQELQKRLTGKSPTFLVSVRKGLRVPKCLGERYNGRLAIRRTGKLLGVGEDDVEIKGDEEPVEVNFRVSI